ncbi:MFS transporter [Streptantibioticus cattleyicolor]|uniref:Drug/proton antiporter n=1 Tax=Streptantibioticus cattleyicolor (strain ATCC 35852 / DSM 46488 / JCM 4925 / NBRC 14057 / NRRL 8057) TaxID=1003195 RepID=F8JLJ4_STREN|nr:MFS transporter [Streptantibioticus cattleyicolor]AEW98287.1 drug/proton antiporter [Streptantibioticus cattleyicolor NRRL 8057 = DSM 46488]CCB72653.1 putative drug/proton antiporter [Streptantibioticus cattleyicolor NRRL 8057 = DSM 46488]
MSTNQTSPADQLALGDDDMKPARPSAALTLTAALLGFALICLDASVVNVALPAIGTSLDGGMAALQWVVDAYTLAFAALMLSTGAFSDRAGASRAFALGTAVFTLASAACGLAPNLPTLIGARVVQGVAAAVVLPASLALVRQAYPEPARRARAVAAWAAGGSLAVALGPVAGGALTTVWDWRGIFFVNLPLGAAILVLLVRAPRSRPRPAPLDLPGQLTAVVALVALTFAAIEGGTAGWAALAVAVVAGAVFLRVEARQPHPVVPLGLFRNWTVVAVVVAGGAVSVAFYSMVFVFSLFFQQVQGHSALYAGLMFLPMTGLIAVTNVLAGKLAGRYGPRLPMLIGQPLAVAGLLVLLVVSAHTPAPLVSVLLVPLALGCALTVPPLTAAMMDAVPAERAGLAAGVLNAARQVSGGLGIAVFGSLLGHGFETGMRLSLLVGAALLTVACALTFRLPGRSARRA